jgi:hypothetical protein
MQAHRKESKLMPNGGEQSIAHDEMKVPAITFEAKKAVRSG